MITKIAFFAQPTKNMSDMRRFYGETLGLALTGDYGDMWAEFDTPDGKSVALDPHSAQQPDASPYVALETDDIDAEVENLKSHGATIAKDVWANEHEGKLICKMAVVIDPDGNPIMLHQIADWRAQG